MEEMICTSVVAIDDLVGIDPTAEAQSPDEST